MNNIKIGIDCLILRENGSGISRYIHEVTYAMAKYKCTIVVYYQDRKSIKFFNEFNNIIYRRCPFKSKLLRIIWFQTFLPFYIKQDNLDVFWGPAHRIPFFISKKIKTIVTIHDLVWAKAGFTMKKLNYLLEKFCMPFALYRSDLIITISNSTAQDIVEKYPKLRNKIKMIYPGVKQFRKIKELPKEISDLIKKKFILFIGTLEPRKNLLRLLKAYFKALDEKDTEVNLFIVGMKGWGNQKIKTILKSCLHHKRVFFLGHINDSILPYLYENAEFLIMPSLYEGFGLPIVESMSFGKAVITSNNSSMREIVGKAGILINPSKVDSIKDGILRFLDKEVLENYSIHAKMKASEFSWIDSTEKIWEEIKKLSKK